MFSSAVSQFSWTQERQSFVAQSVNKCEGNGRCWKEDSDRDNKGTVSTWTALHGPWHAVNMDQQTVSLHSFSWIESHVAMEHLFADLLYPWVSLDARCFRPRHVKPQPVLCAALSAVRETYESTWRLGWRNSSTSCSTRLKLGKDEGC